jgi:hypothetical protein
MNYDNLKFEQETKKKETFLPQEDINNILGIFGDRRFESVLKYNRKRTEELRQALELINPLKNPEGIISAQNLIAGINDLEKFVREQMEEMKSEDKK